MARLARSLVHGLLANLAVGRITILDSHGEQSFGAADAPADWRAAVEVRDPRFYSALAFGGSVAAGQAFANGWWDCDDLTALVRMVARNAEINRRMDRGWAALARPIYQLWHRMRRNSKANARQNIAEHYDLGNEFFSLFLDETMMYSAGYFETESTPLFDASVAKLDRVCRKLDLRPGDRLLEIGTGWGGLAEHAARHFGCQVTTTTISRQQFDFAVARVRSAGLQDRVTVLLEDYRDLTGQYDKLVSIEMLEAVGHQYFDAYFRQCARLLTANGRMLVQSITIADQQYETYRRSVDFIQRFVFPGGCLPSVTAICASTTRASDLRLFDLEDLTPHYALTLRQWSQRFGANLNDVRGQGFSEEFIRLWQYYLSYCEGGFLEHVIGVVQLLLAKPGWRGGVGFSRHCGS